MRLEVLGRPRGPLQHLAFRMVARQYGEVPGPVAVMSYRRDLHGKHMAKAFQEAMRRISFWEVRDVELFAAFVSRQNQCSY